MSNTVTLIGNITKDPELRFTATGQATANFGLAVNRRWQNKQTNAWEETVSFFNIVAWRELAENCGESLRKGTRAMVTGRIEQRSWENAEHEKKTIVEIVADEIGPSLRWATAQVSRNERTSAPSQVGQPVDVSVGASSAAHTSAAPPHEYAPPSGYDEEPF